MKRLALPVAALLALLALPAPAGAGFGLSDFEFRFDNEDGSRASRAGSHPFRVESYFALNFEEDEGSFSIEGGDVKDLSISSIRGLTGGAAIAGDNPALPRCSTVDFATDLNDDGIPECAIEAAVGLVGVMTEKPEEGFPVAAPLYNLTPPPGVPLRLGFVYTDVPVTIDISIKPAPDHNAVARLANVSQAVPVFRAVTEIWGVPADPAHDFLRGKCGPQSFPDPQNLIVDGELNYEKGLSPEEECESEAPELPFLTLPRSCAGPLLTGYEMDSWLAPGAWVRGAHVTPALSGCSAQNLPFEPQIASEATTDSAATGSGQDFELEFVDEVDGIEGITEPEGTASSDMKAITVTLPEGMTVNPSLAEGLGVCTPRDLDEETLAASPGEGCPNDSKIGTVEVDTPIVSEPIGGSVFLARQGDPSTAFKENPFDSLIALYVVFKDKGLGALVKQPLKVEPDPETGRLIASTDEVPQIPFSRLRFHFREGRRAPLITPPRCGRHETVAELVPWARPGEEVKAAASFEITRGVNGGPCPPGGIPPFAPGFEAGSANNAAGRFSPFLMRIARADGHQDLTRFSATLPRGVTGRLAGVPECPEALIAAAKSKRGRAERAAPSCPPASRIGGTLAAAGVGSALTHVPGHLYLAGPYNGAPLSVVAITPAVAGPFDVGTVVVRVALTVDPRSAEVSVDGARSDPIPHILAGIPLNVRDLRVAADRPGFTLNPTSCEPKGTHALAFGSFADLFDPADDLPVALFARYQAADCASLPYAPRLGLRLKGGTGRGAFPAFRALFRPRAGHANSRRLVLRFPRSAFLEQGHFRTICTRVQFAAEACPKGAVYGHAIARTPLLDEPLRGPVYLRSSDNELPDVVFDLHGRVDVEAVARIDSAKGGIRATVEGIPDAPISSVLVRMQGGRKGLIVNSRDICQTTNRAAVKLIGHSNARRALRPALRGQCGKRAGRGSRRSR